MESISIQRRRELLDATRDLMKLELRDNYGMDGDDLKAWLAGDLDTVEASYAEWAESMASMTAHGQTFRRVRVVSEPLSDYQQMAVRFSGLAVDEGEQLRWLPRRLVSAVPLPGNDAFVMDGTAAMFNVLNGNDDKSQPQYSRDPEVVKFCINAFEAAWELAVPHYEYQRAR
ncbi:hypothetical protein J4573_38115 [Actinomadura barringtoniae]|uniref:DUF6879 domain-containing protein n=1 Tax=Actinomadura barringtoniae TaxID=1427535 RepID=A0A939PPR7_9ACTN|nr:DUF6879 family protein [Actinomadura barringtoniae]MBO2452959.1 hypothetical protein [Actinomadura barringtoniae]